jgi:hypothetical protein
VSGSLGIRSRCGNPARDRRRELPCARGVDDGYAGGDGSDDPDQALRVEMACSGRHFDPPGRRPWGAELRQVVVIPAGRPGRWRRTRAPLQSDHEHRTQREPPPARPKGKERLPPDQHLLHLSPGNLPGLGGTNHEPVGIGPESNRAADQRSEQQDINKSGNAADHYPGKNDNGHGDGEQDGRHQNRGHPHQDPDDEPGQAYALLVRIRTGSHAPIIPPGPRWRKPASMGPLPEDRQGHSGHL